MWLEHNGHLRLYPPAPVCKPVLQKINSRIVLQNYQKPPVIQIKTRKNIFFLKKNRERFGGFKIKLYFCTRKQAPKGAEMQT
ncbi:hypothetical protein IMSAGC014_00545 [Bacteroidaceae bacterium]|uniref:hypothetical protein n=1 Tax=Prevotella sp. MGM2 TaxID=2033406 RepID=UPI0010574034|nr:hypothetical protein [Prevotella sp. MGM2]GFI34057.1 hypothetical protein IMSAGC014_00545 [Bacteroidaceae bacterium]